MNVTLKQLIKAANSERPGTALFALVTLPQFAFAPRGDMAKRRSGADWVLCAACPEWDSGDEIDDDTDLDLIEDMPAFMNHPDIGDLIAAARSEIELARWP